MVINYNITIPLCIMYYDHRRSRFCREMPGCHFLQNRGVRSERKTISVHPIATGVSHGEGFYYSLYFAGHLNKSSILCCFMLIAIKANFIIFFML